MQPTVECLKISQNYTLVLKPYKVKIKTLPHCLGESIPSIQIDMEWELNGVIRLTADDERMLACRHHLVGRLRHEVQALARTELELDVGSLPRLHEHPSEARELLDGRAHETQRRPGVEGNDIAPVEIPGVVH